MKPQIYLEKCPERLISKAEEYNLIKRSKHYYNRWPVIVYQEIKDDLLYTLLYDGKEVCEDGVRRPRYIIAANMEKRKWDTFSVQEKKWGKKTLRTLLQYKDVVEERIDDKIFGLRLEDMQFKVNADDLAKKHNIRDREIQSDMAKAKPLPEGLKKWAVRQLKPFLVYEPEKNKWGTCTRCGKETEFHTSLKVYTKRKCPHCRTSCHVRTPKKMPDVIERTVCYIQKTDTGIMVRFVVVTRKKEMKHPELWEGLRVVVNRGNKQRWYEKRDWAYGDERWKRNGCEKWVKNYNNPDHTMEIYYEHGGAVKGNGLAEYQRNMTGIIASSSLAYMEDWEEMLSCIVDYRRYLHPVYGFIDLYDRIHRFPQIESLWKLGFRNLAVELICCSSVCSYGKGTELHKWLGISKEMWRFISAKGTREKITWGKIQILRRVDTDCPEKETAWKAAVLIPTYHVDTYKGLPLKKVVRYIEQKKNESLYADYISMAKTIGYDLADDFVAFPRNLEAAHDEAIEVRKEETDRKAREEAKKYDAEIFRIYKKIKDRYTFEYGEFLFRPAMSNYEIVKEGQTLHHCVGHGQYRRKMAEGKSYIVFLRRKEKPDNPFYTIEIDTSGTILQAYGKHNTKPEWETIESVLEKYSEKVRKTKCQKAFYRKTGTNVIYVDETV